MRCPSCARETPDGSRFCGICGHPIDASPGYRPSPAPAAPAPAPRVAYPPSPQRPRARSRDRARTPDPVAAPEASSSFVLPVSRGAWLARVIALLALDAVLIGVGIALFLSYLDAREQALRAPPPHVDDAVVAPAGSALGPQRFQAPR